MREVLTVLPQVGLTGQLVVLMLLLGSTAWACRRPGVLPLAGLTACVTIWLRANSRLEGAVVVSLTPAHGLTLADLLVPAIGCAVLLARRSRTVETAPAR